VHPDEPALVDGIGVQVAPHIEPELADCTATGVLSDTSELADRYTEAGAAHYTETAVSLDRSVLFGAAGAAGGAAVARNAGKGDPVDY